MENTCAQIRPDWNGNAVTALSEAITLAVSPFPLVLFALTLVVIFLRHQWGALVLVVSWSLYVSFLTMFDTTGTLAAARSEGCVGSPTLFIAVVAAICVAMIIYTAPREARDSNGDS